ncbi:HalOD1 output domain-containing protein [Halorussus marinus]|uniref:HalOD1 output domain-containing protein n=1 Tax=Halorussus marinus TaxID=2505976 RepID=UPI00142FF146|nr:HalOD1 output domain-containing protein [Halorussus marinus]
MTNDSEETDDEAIHVGRYDADERISVRVASDLADVLDVDPTDVDLYENVDTEALDRLFDSTRDGVSRTGRVVFEAEGHHITVRSDGTFTIARADG